MTIDRPTGRRRPPWRRLPAPPAKHRWRRILTALATGLGVAFGTYGAIGAITGRSRSVADSVETLDSGSTSAEPDPKLKPGQRAVAIPHNRLLPLDVGDSVELIAVLPGPIDAEAELVARAEILSLHDEAVVVAVDTDTAVELIEAQANGIVRLVGLP